MSWCTQASAEDESKPDGDVGHDRGARGAGTRAELHAARPTAPSSRTRRGRRARRRSRRPRPGSPVLLGPGAPVRVAHRLGEHAPGREAAQVLATGGDPHVVLDRQVVPGRVPDPLERGALELPDGVPLDEAAVVQRAGRAGEVGQLDVVGTRDVLDRDVQQLQPLARRRRVRRRLLRQARRGGVHRGDEHRRRPGLAGLARDAGEVAELADAPGLARARGVQLHGPAPAALGLREARGGADDHAGAAVGRREAVVAGVGAMPCTGAEGAPSRVSRSPCRSGAGLARARTRAGRWGRRLRSRRRPPRRGWRGPARARCRGRPRTWRGPAQGGSGSSRDLSPASMDVPRHRRDRRGR